MRTFISLNFTDEYKNDIYRNQKEIKQLSDDFSNDIRWENPEQFHITLKFLNEQSENSISGIINSLENISNLNLGEINLELESFNAFPSLKSPRVLVLKLRQNDDNLQTLVKNINNTAEKYSVPQSPKMHTPHITIGRVRNFRKINLMNIQPKIFKKTFHFREFFLMQSVLSKQGARHSVIKSFKL